MSMLDKQILAELKIITRLLKEVLAKPSAAEELIDKIDNIIVTKPPASYIEFWNLNTNTKEDKMFLKADQKLPISIKIKDAQGNEAKCDGLPQWKLSDEAAGNLQAAADGMSAVFSPAGHPVVFKVQVMVDADLGEGVKPILGEMDVEVLSGEAVSVELFASEPFIPAPVEAPVEEPAPAPAE